MPQGVDVDAIKKQLIDVSNLIAGIFSKYAVDSVDKLEELYANYQNISKQLEILHINLGTSLNSMSCEQLEKDFNALPEGLMSIDEVTKKIKDICGAKDIQEMIDDGKEIEVNCHFCNTNYKFSVEELKALLKQCKR